MSLLTISADWANTFVMKSGVQMEIVVKFNLTVPHSTVQFQHSAVRDQKIAYTFSNDIKDRTHISSSATMAEWRRVAHLARIAISENEVLNLSFELNSIMAFVNQICEVDVEGIGPMTSVTPMTMKMRQDEVTDGGIPDAVIANAPAHEHHFFLVPKVVE